MIVVIVLFLALCMFSFLPKVKKNYSPVNNGNLINREENPLDGATTTCLKGIFAITIVMHHFVCHFSEIGMPFFFQTIFERAGASGVGVFFMLSAFGLTRSYLKRPRYLKSILTKKIPTLYLIYLSTALIYLAVNGFAGGGASLIWVLLFRGRDFWFVFAIIVFYIIFTIVLASTKNLKNRNDVSLAIIFAFTFLAFIISVIIAPNELVILVRAIFCFPLGMAYALYYKEVNSFLKKFWLPILLVVGLIIGTDAVFGYLENEQGRSLITCIFIITLVSKVNIKTPVAYALGIISLEIYLLHALIQNLCIVWFPDNVNVFTIVSLLLSIVSAAVFHMLIFGVKKLIYLTKKKGTRFSIKAKPTD